MADPIDIARAAWPGEWTTDGTFLSLYLPNPFTGSGACGVFAAPSDEIKDGWCVGAWVSGELVVIHGIDLAKTLQLARTTTVRELTPLLRALGADLITAALAATE